MTITKINCTNYNHNLSPSFGAGKTTLYTDFDGTLLPTSLSPLYERSELGKENCVKNFNTYFAEFQSMLDKAKENFKIFITTGRRLNGDRREGFEETYNKIFEDGLRLPKITGLITAEGGDIHHFNSNGKIDNIPDPQKLKLVKELSGWDNAEIKKILDEILGNGNTEYKFINQRGSFKLTIQPKDANSLEFYMEQIQKALQGKMKVKYKINNKVKILKEKMEALYEGYKSKVEYPTDPNANYVYTKGICLEPIINGHSIHKDLDVKFALKQAIQNNDFIIAAGDADNDKEMLNIFHYINLPNSIKPPENADQITSLLDKNPEIKTQIANLPIRLLFVEPDFAKMTQYKEQDIKKIKRLFDFIKKQESIFPNQVKIIKKTTIGKDNFFLDEIKNSIKTYAQSNKAFMEALGKDAQEFLRFLELDFPLKRSLSKSKIALIALPAVSLLSYAAYKLTYKKKQQPQNSTIKPELNTTQIKPRTFVQNEFEKFIGK